MFNVNCTEISKRSNQIKGKNVNVWLKAIVIDTMMTILKLYDVFHLMKKKKTHIAYISKYVGHTKAKQMYRRPTQPNSYRQKWTFRSTLLFSFFAHFSLVLSRIIAPNIFPTCFHTNFVYTYTHIYINMCACVRVCVFIFFLIWAKKCIHEMCIEWEKNRTECLIKSSENTH